MKLLIFFAPRDDDDGILNVLILNATQKNIHTQINTHTHNTNNSAIVPWIMSKKSCRQERDLQTRTDRFGVEVRERVMWDIREGVVGADTFIPKHVVIITWKNMSFAGGIDISLYKVRSKNNTCSFCFFKTIITFSANWRVYRAQISTHFIYLYRVYWREGERKQPINIIQML